MKRGERKAKLLPSAPARPAQETTAGAGPLPTATTITTESATQEFEARSDPDVDVVIVGAGPAGIGMALALEGMPGLAYKVLESGRVGESFRRWPPQTRFITPSFHSNPFGLADLNAVDPTSSPAHLTGAEHLSGAQYADYLRFLVDADALPVSCGCKVLEVHPRPPGEFRLITEQGELDTRFLIWACGEYQFTDLTPFPGGQWCLHYAQVANWQSLEAGDYTVIGGFESGVDASFNLLKLGARVRLLVRRPTWDLPEVDDPSLALSPYSRERLREMETSDALEIVYDADVVKVTLDNKGEFRINGADGRHWEAKVPPVLGTGFLKGGGARWIADLWEWSDEGHIRLSPMDESTLTPGLFLVGPQVRHDQGIYCFIYKFRQRFGLIAREIAERLALDAIPAGQPAGAWGPFGNTECCEACEC
jgi:thioredoxin reductase